jgi:hypothetical protein
MLDGLQCAVLRRIEAGIARIKERLPHDVVRELPRGHGLVVIHAIAPRCRSENTRCVRRD